MTGASEEDISAGNLRFEEAAGRLDDAELDPARPGPGPAARSDPSVPEEGRPDDPSPPCEAAAAAAVPMVVVKREVVVVKREELEMVEADCYHCLTNLLDNAQVCSPLS